MLHPITFDENELPFSTLYGDHYYSRHDGRAECAHVFLAGNGLPTRWQDTKVFTIGELGFGTGLNFLETWSSWKLFRKPGQQLNYVSVEAMPMVRNVARRALGQWPKLEPLTSQLLNQWGCIFSKIQMDDQTCLHVFKGEAVHLVTKFPKIDAWYLDGFAPSKNPEMWSQSLMKIVAERTNQGGTCASYTAAGWVRRNLENAGFEIDKRDGFGSKRDMIVGTLK
ncbi:MAG: tRNA (5-methylaminomethyl-2-thiouridine)(34)-methyltransferase MnmD [Rhizobiaceae bacterium]